MAALAELVGQGFHSFRGCAAALDALDRHAAFLERWRARTPDTPAGASRLAAQPPGVIDEAATRILLEAYDVPVPQNALATTRDDAARKYANIGFPVVLKIKTPDIADRKNTTLNSSH